MTVLDGIILGLLLVPVLLGLSRGALRSIFNLVAWLGAFLATVVMRPVLAPALAESVNEPIVADSLAIGLPFILTLVMLQLLFGSIVRYLRSHTSHGIDHLFGLIFGAIFGLLLVGLTWVLVLGFLPGLAAGDMAQRSRALPLLNLLANPTREAFNRVLPEAYALPDAAPPPNSGRPADTEEIGDQTLLLLDDGERIRLSLAPPKAQTVVADGAVPVLARAT